MPSDNNAFPAPKLPVIRTIEEGLAALRPLWRRIALQLLLLLLIQIGFGLVAVAMSGDSEHFLLGRGSPNSKHVSYGLMLFANGLIVLVIYINLSLGTTKLVLFNEPPTLGGLFRWDRRQWRLLGNLLLVGLVAAVPVVVGAFMTPSLGPLLATPLAVLALQAIYGLCWLWAVGWLQLLPSVVASDRAGSALDLAWQASAGNRLRLMGLALCGVVANLLVIGSGMLASNFLAVDLLSIRIIGHLLRALAGGAIYVVFAASAAVAYRWLTGANAQATADI
jgi:hypothetical protein